jgi:hypothetical protein
MADVGQCAKLPLNMAIPELSFTKVVVHSCAIRPSGYLAVLAERLGQFLALWAQGSEWASLPQSTDRARGVIFWDQFSRPRPNTTLLMISLHQVRIGAIEDSIPWQGAKMLCFATSPSYPANQEHPKTDLFIPPGNHDEL